ncbi:hypothetical protein [Mycoplasmopsis agassizii]|uniref:Uncharacterized protein n=1 Tax=Mycoplasmopsis agassizii TaxID=33922 RepID=A0ABX4H6D8_9BACT|nr:hypothetical protein [Mycoplasmopsis agassizii]PAF55418.1 hypothetical protein CJF60_01910 [Mycoplasmopsis agassizii]SMC18362.1 hypothetical protein SAMN02745179_00665 [Mycoplasmopsis agassizii]
MKKVNKSKILKSLMLLGSVGSLASIISTVALSPFQQTSESKISNTIQEVSLETDKKNIREEYQIVLNIIGNKLSQEQEKIVKSVMHQTSSKLANEDLNLSQALQIIENNGVKVDKEIIQRNIKNFQISMLDNEPKIRKKRFSQPISPSRYDYSTKIYGGGDGYSSYGIKENAKDLHNRLRTRINELKESTNRLQTIHTGLITAAIILFNPLIITLGVVIYTLITESNRNRDNILKRIQDHLFEVANFELEIVINTFGYLDAIADQLLEDGTSSIGIFTNIITKPTNKISEVYLKTAGFIFAVKMLISLLKEIKKVIKSNRDNLYNQIFL